MYTKYFVTYALFFSLICFPVHGDNCLTVAPDCYPVTSTCTSKIITKLCERNDEKSIALAQQIIQNTASDELLVLLKATQHDDCLGTILANIARDTVYPSNLLHNFIESIFNPLFSQTRTSIILSFALEKACSMQTCDDDVSIALQNLVQTLVNTTELNSMLLVLALCDMVKRCVNSLCVFNVIELIYCASVTNFAQPEKTLFGDVIRCLVCCMQQEKCIGFDGAARLFADFLFIDPKSFRPIAQALADGSCCYGPSQPCSASEHLNVLAKSIALADVRFRACGEIKSSKSKNGPTRECACCGDGCTAC